MGMWGTYVSQSERRAKAKKKMDQLKKKGKSIEPIEIAGRTIATEFWGKKWCDHLESFADYDNRLTRGRTYARNGSICHLGIEEGRSEAMVSGSDIYKVSIEIKALCKNKWEAIKKRCQGQIGSVLELLKGKLSHHVMEIVADEEEGLFPHEEEIEYQCNCPDWADMCKHVAAVLYGIGNRLDTRPELLFLLRGVDPSELVHTELDIKTAATADLLHEQELASLFDIQLDEAPEPIVVPKKGKKKESKSSWDPETLTGKQLQKFREQKGLSVAELAKALEVTPPSIYRWEKCSGVIKLQSRIKKAFRAFAS